MGPLFYVINTDSYVLQSRASKDIGYTVNL